MNPRTLLLALAALTTAGLTAFLVQGWMERQRAQMIVKAPVAPKPVGTSVLVSNRDIGAGTFLKEPDIKWQVWPEGNLSPAYAVKGTRKLSEFVGSVVRSRIVAGQPITDSSVVKVGERGFLAAVLSPGLRAVSVPVTAASAIAGLVFPGDRVDLILSHKFKAKAQGRARQKLRLASETVLTNVRILALDQRTDDKKNKGAKKAVPKTATIEITPKQAELISVALNLGKLSLSLRSLARDEPGPDGKKPAKEKSHARGKTLTTDTEVSRLLSYLNGKEEETIFILRGGLSQSSSVEESDDAAGDTAKPKTKARPRDEDEE